MRVLLVEEGWTPTLYVATALEAAGYAVTVATAGGNGESRFRAAQRRVDLGAGDRE